MLPLYKWPALNPIRATPGLLKSVLTKFMFYIDDIFLVLAVAEHDFNIPIGSIFSEKAKRTKGSWPTLNTSTKISSAKLSILDIALH